MQAEKSFAHFHHRVASKSRNEGIVLKAEETQELSVPLVQLKSGSSVSHQDCKNNANKQETTIRVGIFAFLLNILCIF
jgi:hypothetical protein